MHDTVSYLANVFFKVIKQDIVNLNKLWIQLLIYSDALTLLDYPTNENSSKQPKRVIFQIIFNLTNLILWLSRVTNKGQNELDN